MAKLRRLLGNAELHKRLVKGELARRGRQEVLSAQDVGHSHKGIVDRVNQRVERRTVRACHDVVRLGLRLEGHLAAHQVSPGPILVRHAQAPHRLATFRLEGVNLFLSEVAVEVVVA